MPVHLGTSAIDTVKMGADQVDALYLGAQEVWSAVSEPVPQPDLALVAGGSAPEGVYLTSILRTPDAVTWSESLSSTSHIWHTGDWSPERGIYLYGCFTDPAATGPLPIAISPDGINWSTHDLPINRPASVYGIRWSSSLGKFVVTGNKGPSGAQQVMVLTSPDGIAWTEHSQPYDNGAGNNNIKDLEWSPELGLFIGMFVGLGMGRSSDGVNWTIGSLPEGGTDIIARPIWCPGLGLFLSSMTTADFRRGTIRSSDGINWIFSNLGWSTARSAYTISWSQSLGLALAVGSSANYSTSTDGFTWSPVSTITGATSMSTASRFSERLGLFVVIVGNAIFTSPSGTGSWTQRSTGYPHNWYSVL